MIQRWMLLAVPLLAADLSAQEIGLPVGSAAPNVTIETLDGRPAPLSPNWGKRPVLLEFWATWCPNCEQIEPAVRRVAERFRGRLDVVGVTVSYNQNPERVKRYAERHGLTHSILYDRAGDASEAYRVPATSYVVIVGTDGRVAYTGLGGDQALEAAVERILAAEAAKRPASASDTTRSTRPTPDRP